MDRSYNGPPRQGPVRHISPAQLNLERIYEQNRLNVQKKDAAKTPEPAPGQAAKGKPRLLLMGQRRLAQKSLHVITPLKIGRSGKSSISSVVFHKMPPNETLFLESTARIQKDSMQ
jgi:Ras-related GTP-binding protein C/D